MSEIYKVTVSDIGKGYRYTAHFDGNATEVVRKKATRVYHYAIQWDKIVATGNKSGLTQFFSFSAKPLAVGFQPGSYQYAPTVVAVFPVQLERETFPLETLAWLDGRTCCKEHSQIVEESKA